MYMKNEYFKAFFADIEIIETLDSTRKPTQKRVYKNRFTYKIKFMSVELRATDKFCDYNNKILFYVLSVDAGCVIATNIKPALELKHTKNIRLIKAISSYPERQIKTNIINTQSNENSKN